MRSREEIEKGFADDGILLEVLLDIRELLAEIAHPPWLAADDGSIRPVRLMTPADGLPTNVT